MMQFIAGQIGETIAAVQPVSGGDISAAYRIQTRNTSYFCKLHRSEQAYAMFLAEKDGLEAIAATGCIASPKVILCQQFHGFGVLLMEFIAAKRPETTDLARLGEELAAMHLCRSDRFGGQADNFIGSLRQSNSSSDSWPVFYVAERLSPQLQLALHGNRLTEKEIPSEGMMQDVMDDFCKDIKPGLIHGDLWGGNYLIAPNGTPYLIDPAVYHGHNEVDLAMSRLFGGFGEAFYKAYEEVIPQQPGAAERSDLYQLYYLLVHLNLFGRSYYSAVKQILNTYFSS